MELLQSGEPGCDLPPISFEYRMAIVYRSEKKKIIRSQMNLIEKVLKVLKSAEQVLRREGETDPSRAYQNLILQETNKEREWRE